LVLWICALLAHASGARAEEPSLAQTPTVTPGRWSAELAAGVVRFGDGATPLEAGLGLDLGLSVLVSEFFVARAALGLLCAADRHTLEFLGRARLEGALRLKSDKAVALLGAGGALWNRSPSVHGLLGLGVPLSANWQLGVDVRAGLFWDFDWRRRTSTPFGEAQLRASWAFR
jgi:hypothetical protein